MKKILMSAAAVAMFFATGCSNEELVQSQQAESQEVSLELNMGVDSRTEMTDNGCVWKVGDAIYAFSEDENVWGVLRIESNSDISNNGKTAKFKGTKNGTADLKHVIYPAKENDKNVRPSEFSINVEHVEGNEGLKAPMVAEIGTNTTFDYVGGLVKFQITGLGNKEVVFNAKINGVNVTGGLYRWENGGLKHDPKNSTTTTVHSIPEDGVFYLPVAVTTKAGEDVAAPEAVITAYAQNNPGPEGFIGYIIGNAQGNGLEIPVSKGDISTKEVPNYVVGEDGDVTVSGLIYNIEEFKKAFEDGGSYKLVNDIDLEDDVTLSDDRELLIDLNGNGLIGEYESVCQSGGKLTLKNGYMESTATAVLSEGGELSLVGMNIVSKSTKKETIVAVTGTAVAEILGGSYTSETEPAEGISKDWYAIAVKDGAEAELNTTVSGKYNGGVTVHGAKVDFIGGSYSGDLYYGLYMYGNAEVTYDTEKVSFKGKTINVYADGDNIKVNNKVVKKGEVK